MQIVDIGGFGGTNFSKIENKRRKRLLPFFDQWGIPTAASIVEAKYSGSEIDIIASGGIQNSLDIAKSIALGANLVGISGYFLKILIKEGLDGLMNEVSLLHEELTLIMTALGVRAIDGLQQTPLVISGEMHHWLKERNIDTKKYSTRKTDEKDS